MALKVYLNYFVQGTPIFSAYSSIFSTQYNEGLNKFIDTLFPMFLKRLNDRGLLKKTKTGDSVTVFLSGRANYCQTGYAIRITCSDGVFDSQNYGLWWEGAVVGYLCYKDIYNSSYGESIYGGGFSKTCIVPSGYNGFTIPSPEYPTDSIPVNAAIKTLAYIEKKIFEYNRKVSVSVQEKQLTNGDVARWVVAAAGAIGEGFQSATSSSVGAAFVKEMKEFANLFKFTSGLVNQTKSACVIDVGKLEESAQSNIGVTFSNVKQWFNVVGLPAVYKTALGCQTILGKVAMPMATFLPIAPKLEGDYEEYIYLTADNQVSSTETDKRIVIKGKLTTSDYWDLYSQAMLEEYGNDITGGTYSETANDVSTAAEAYAQQQQAAAQNAYYDAMSEYYQKLNNGETTVTGTVTLTVPETAKVGLNILEGQAITLDSSSVDGLTIPLDIAGVESMTPIPVDPIQWDGNSPPPWIANPIELHLSDMLTNWQPTVQIESPTEPVPINVTGNVTATGTVTASGSVTASGNVTASGAIDLIAPTSIPLSPPTSIPLEGPTSIPLTAPTEPLNLTFDTTSAEAIKAISDNIAARTELETTRAEADTVLRDLQITNEQTRKDNKQLLQDKLYADVLVATSEAAVRGATYGTGANAIEYVPAQVQAYNNLHDLAERESIALGQVLKFPQGVIPSLMQAHLPALLAEIQQSKITENIRSENRADDEDWDLDSDLMKLLFFNIDSDTKSEVMQKYGDEIRLIFKLVTPLGILAKIKDYMELGD